MPTRLKRRVRRAAEPLPFHEAFRLASRVDAPGGWVDLGGRRAAPRELVLLFSRDPRAVLTLWSELVRSARRRLAAPSPVRSAAALADDELWAAGDRLPWVVREALGTRCPSTRRGVEALLSRYGVLAPAGAVLRARSTTGSPASRDAVRGRVEPYGDRITRAGLAQKGN